MLLYRDRELLKTYTALPETAVALGALFELFAQLLRLLFIAVDFPETDTLIIVPIVDEALDIRWRIAQKQADLMREVLLGAKALHKMSHAGGAA